MDILNHPRNKDIWFDPVSHKYLYQYEEFFSGVTSWISQYKQPFKKDVIAGAVARRDGKRKEDVLAEWDEKRDTSAEYGNFAHNAIERWVNKERLLRGQKEYVDLVKMVLKNEDLSPIRAEFVVYDERIKKASPIDLLCTNKEGRLVVVDIKTYEKGVEWTGYKDACMQYPLHDLSDANYYHTSLQTSIYIKWLKEFYNLDVEDYGYILHLRPPQCSLIKTVNLITQVNLMYEQDYQLQS
jgi:ATP-dependent exoDNAse (exonuclease V) beta subunit